VGCGKGGSGWRVAIEHFGQARSDGCIMVLSKLVGETGGGHAELVVAPGAGAVQKQQP